MPRTTSLLSSPLLDSSGGPALARLAVGEDVEGVSVVCSEGRRQIKSSVDSYDEKKQEGDVSGTQFRLQFRRRSNFGATC